MTARKGKRRPARFVVVRKWAAVMQGDSFSHCARRWYFRIVAANGRILAHSEHYNSRASVMKAIRAIMQAKEIEER